MPSRPNLVLDARHIGSREGGNETYIVELLRNLPRLDHAYDFHLLVKSQDTARRALAQAASAYAMHPLPSRSIDRVLYGVPRQAQALDADLYQAQYRFPLWSMPCRTVLVLHDISHEHYPQLFTLRHRLTARLHIRWSARRATHIITVSEYSKQDIIRTYGIDPASISVTYEAANESFRPLDPQEARQRVRRRFGVRNPYILYVGNIHPRKNLATLVKAYADVRSKNKLPHKLVIVGQKAWLTSSVFAAVRQLDLTDQVVFTEYVPDDDLPYLYNAADLFVYPSIFEGFGLPLLEAMACRTPVITSSASCLPEIAGDAAVLVNPNDATAIARAIVEVAEDASLRERLAEKGQARAQRFTWQETARQTLAVYEKLLGQTAASGHGRPCPGPGPGERDGG